MLMDLSACIVVYFTYQKKKMYCCLLGKEGEKNPESYFSCGHAVQKKLKKSKAKESQVRERERERMHKERGVHIGCTLTRDEQ